MGRLEGKVAVITGGASGIGEAAVRLFAREGARVLIADLQYDVAEALATELGENVAAVKCNVAIEEDVRGAIGETVSRWGRLDVLFNNAGFGGASGPIEETSVEEYDVTMDVLLKSVFLGTKHATPVMKAQGGAIVNTASVCSFEAGIGNQLYSVAKAGVAMMTKAAAIELAEHGIRVNAVCPGYIPTPLSAGRAKSEHAGDVVDAALERTRGRFADLQPIPRAGDARDIANAVLFLASDEASFVTGEMLRVDGGLLAGRPWRKLSGVITQRREAIQYHPGR